MKKPRVYLLSILLTVLTVFCCIGLTAAGLVRWKALSMGTCTRLVASENLPGKVHDSLAAFYQQQENVTAIPAETYADAISEDRLRPMILDTVSNAFGYLSGREDKIGIAPDFSVLEQNLTDFFSRYADENGYQKDAAYDKALSDAIAAAKRSITSACDVFRFSTLDDAGLMQRARKAVPLTVPLMIGCLAGIVVMTVLLILLHRKEKARVCYWLGTAVLVSSLLMLIPAVWLRAVRWFDRFAVKSDQVFAAVTGYLYAMTNAVITVAVIGLFLSACCYLFSGILGSKRRRPPL